MVAMSPLVSVTIAADFGSLASPPSTFPITVILTGPELALSVLTRTPAWVLAVTSFAVTVTRPSGL